MKLSANTMKALRLIASSSDGIVSAGRFYEDMGYGRPGVKASMKGPGGSSVLKRLAKRGLVYVWDDWIGSGAYTTLATLTDEGRRVLNAEAPHP